MKLEKKFLEALSTSRICVFPISSQRQIWNILKHLPFEYLSGTNGIVPEHTRKKQLLKALGILDPPGKQNENVTLLDLGLHPLREEMPEGRPGSSIRGYLERCTGVRYTAQGLCAKHFGYPTSTPRVCTAVPWRQVRQSF